MPSAGMFLWNIATGANYLPGILQSQLREVILKEFPRFSDLSVYCNALELLIMVFPDDTTVDALESLARESAGNNRDEILMALSDLSDMTESADLREKARKVITSVQNATKDT
jgi:hypothetical protein